MTLALGVLVSGNGSNLQAILDAIAAGVVAAEVRVVISNRADAYAVARAQLAGVEAVVIPHRDYPTREAFDQELIRTLQRSGVEWVVLAGFMRVLSPEFIQAFPGRILNIHPALLPSFPGTHAIRQALVHGVKITGCTVHFVNEGVDSGRIIAQRAIPVLPEDDEESLAERMHHAEHQLFVEVLRDVAAGRIASHSEG